MSDNTENSPQLPPEQTNDPEIINALAEVAQPIDQIIQQYADDNRKVLLLACLMIDRAKEICDDLITEQGRKQIFQHYV